MSKSHDNSKPFDVGAPVLIPKENLGPSPGTFAGIRKALDDANKRQTVSRSSTCPDFKPGYTTVGLEGDWQSTSLK